MQISSLFAITVSSGPISTNLIRPWRTSKEFHILVLVVSERTSPWGVLASLTSSCADSTRGTRKYGGGNLVDLRYG